jgi:hypothetical protein
VDVAVRGLDRRGGGPPRPQRFTTGSVYCLKYAPDCKLDLGVGRTLRSAASDCEVWVDFSVWLSISGIVESVSKTADKRVRSIPAKMLVEHCECCYGFTARFDIYKI